MIPKDTKLRKTPYLNMAVCDVVLLEGINSVLYKTQLFLVVCLVFCLPINGQSECLVSINL